MPRGAQASRVKRVGISCQSQERADAVSFTPAAFADYSHAVMKLSRLASVSHVREEEDSQPLPYGAVVARYARATECMC